MYVKGRVKWTKIQMSCLHGYLPFRPFDERSERGNAKHLRGSALYGEERAKLCLLAGDFKALPDGI